MEIYLEHLGRGFILMLMLSMPCVLVAASIGLVVGILQAVTQVQEQTIAAAPKILGVFLLIMILGTQYTQMMMNYFFESTNIAFNIVTHRDNFVLPATQFTGKTKFFDAEMNYSNMKEPDKVEKIMKNPGKVPYPRKQEKLKILETPRNSTAGPNLLERITTGR